MAASSPDAADFESAVQAVINGDAVTLQRLLTAQPTLVHARSTALHGATLLHYTAANGVEDRHQKTPPNAVEMAQLLLAAGAPVDAFATMYGAPATTLSMLVSSAHPAKAGVQVALIDTLLDYGAALEGRVLEGPLSNPDPAVTPAGNPAEWESPLMIALASGYPDAAAALVRRGANVNTLAAAAGLGLFADVVRLLPAAPSSARHRALALAAQHGHSEIVRLLLDFAEDPNRYNPPRLHSHSTPLHQAVCFGHAAVVRLLVERGASLSIQDTIYHGTPLGWALHCERPEIAAYLRAQGAS